MKQNNVYPKSFSHIGITVPNLEKAVEFYSNVMGWYIIMQPTSVIIRFHYIPCIFTLVFR